MRRGGEVPFLAAARAVLGTELRGLLRDRRALMFSVLLPVLLYPLLFLLNTRLETISRESMAAREVGVALDLRDVREDVDARLHELLGEERPIRLSAADPLRTRTLLEAAERGTVDAREMERETLGALRAEGTHLLLLGLPHPEFAARTVFRAYYDGANDLSIEARLRVERALELLGKEVRARMFDELLGGDPARGLELEALDIASDEDLGGAALGRILPLLAVLILLSGGSYAALAAFAGERESRTLETLLVQPVASSAIVWGKFAAVLAVGGTTLVLNAVSVITCLALGLGRLPGLDGSGPLTIGLGRVVVSALVFLPACVLLCAVLCLVIGRARSFREGQHYLLPLVMVTMVPALLATRPEVELDLLLACVPLAGPALALRDALTGRLELVPGLVAALASVLWSALALSRLAPLLDAEKTLQHRDVEGEGGLRRLCARNALRFGWAGVFIVYLAGGLVQTLHPLWGLVVTLWIFLPVLALASARLTARHGGEPLHSVLGLRLPHPLHALGAVLLVPGLVAAARAGIEWQQRVLPLPSSVAREGLLPAELASLTGLGAFLLLALSPGICEELFFRGAVLGGLRRDLSRWKVVLWQALLFGAVHASIYRFMPTALLGALLAVLTLRSRSILPAVLVHVGYNGLLVLDDSTFLPVGNTWRILALCLGVLCFLARPRQAATRAARSRS